MTKKLLVFFLCVLMLSTTICPVWATDKVVEQEEKKIYSNYTLEDDFTDDCVIVVLKKESSYINKKYDVSYFGETKGRLDLHNLAI